MKIHCTNQSSEVTQNLINPRHRICVADAHLGTTVCKLGRNPAICLGEEAIFVIGTKVPVSRDL